MNQPHFRSALCLFVGFLTTAGIAQTSSSPIYSFTGYYESVQGTLSYYPSTVHWSYLYQDDGESIQGLRINMPHEGLSKDYDISELWGNDRGIIFICGDLTILVIKEHGSNSPNTPLITISKTSELQKPPGRRSYFRYYTMDHSFEPTAMAGVKSTSDN